MRRRQAKALSDAKRRRIRQGCKVMRWPTRSLRYLTSFHQHRDRTPHRDTRFSHPHPTTPPIMSWSGFKKSINRAGTGIMMKTGQVERTVDPEFADEESKYRQLEKEAASLQKETKAYLDSMRGES